MILTCPSFRHRDMAGTLIAFGTRQKVSEEEEHCTENKFGRFTKHTCKNWRLLDDKKYPITNRPFSAPFPVRFPCFLLVLMPIPLPLVCYWNPVLNKNVVWCFGMWPRFCKILGTASIWCFTLFVTIWQSVGFAVFLGCCRISEKRVGLSKILATRDCGCNLSFSLF